MLIPIKDVENDAEMPEETRRYCSDVLRLATQPMTTIAERGFRLKVLDNLHKVGYYKYKQSAYVNDLKGNRK